MLLSLLIGFSCVRAAVDCTIRERTSGFEPSSETNALRYLKLVMVPSFGSFTLISALMPSDSLSQFGLPSYTLCRFCRDFQLGHLVSALPQLESSANRRFVILLPPMLTLPSCFSRASDMMRSRIMLKRMVTEDIFALLQLFFSTILHLSGLYELLIDTH